MFGQTWSELAAALESQADAGKQVIWRVLFRGRARSILLPETHRAAAAGIRFFCRGLPRRVAGLASLVGDGAAGFFGKAWLPRVSLGGDVPTVNWQALLDGRRISDASIYLGSPGAVQKATLYIPGKGDAVLIKLALLPGADDAVEREAYWLKRVSQVGSLGAFLPSFLGAGILRSGRCFLALGAAPSRAGPQRFSRVHHVFLKRLATLEPAIGPWSQSDAIQRDRARLDRLAPMLEPADLDMFRSALTECAAATDIVPLVTVHGDFAPWNTSWQSGRLVVFDWEYAQAGSSPLQDFLHFHVAQRAVNRRGLRPSDLPAITRAATVFARQQFPEFEWRESFVSRLLLHYLVTTLLFYADTDKRIERNDPVVGSYLEMLAYPEGFLR